MLNTTQTTLANADQAWLSWNNLKLSQRATYLRTWIASLSENKKIDCNASKMANYQLQQAISLLSDSLIMPGPTGEINELSTAGRGVFVIAAQREVPITAIIGFLSCALVTGNTVLLSLSESQQSIASFLCKGLYQAGIDKSVIENTSNSELLALIKAPTIAGVAFIGSMDEAIIINQGLATRKGQIAPLIAEIDHEHLKTLTDSYLVYRFITEKTQTTNVTAVGGNASLLALGGGDQ